METRPRHADDTMGREDHARQCLARVPAPAIRARTLAESERLVGLHHHSEDRSGPFQRAMGIAFASKTELVVSDLEGRLVRLPIPPDAR